MSEEPTGIALVCGPTGSLAVTHDCRRQRWSGLTYVAESTDERVVLKEPPRVQGAEAWLGYSFLVAEVLEARLLGGSRLGDEALTVEALMSKEAKENERNHSIKVVR